MIRYKINVLASLKEEGYNTNTIRKQNLITESTLTRIRHDNMNISLKTIDTLCKLLNCQPGDIIEYIPDEK